jgi:type IV pilus assembly protein PilF
MAECGRLGPGNGWTRILVVFVTGSVLAGCVSAETIKKREKEAEGYYQQGLSTLDTDQQRAFVSFQKAVQANPDNFDAHYALGHVYFLRKEYSNAEREFRACVKRNPNSGEALNYLGRTLVFLSRLPEAIEVLKKAVTLPLYATPDMAYFNLGAALHQQGDIPGTIRAYQEALKIDPPNVPHSLIYLELGRLHMQQGEDSKARDAFTRAKALDPQGTAGAEAAKMMKRLR